ncbi:MAG: biotin/lipoyl-binding protein [Methylococcales bacterium]|nr:biotin/lipoyl-binding protein [Methylococcales bacterium]
MVATTSAWPELREDLAIYPGPRSYDGAPTWTIYDPTSHRYFRIGWLEFECLQRWYNANAEQIALAISQDTPLAVDAIDVEAFASFLNSHQLAKPCGPEASQHLAKQRLAYTPGFWRWLLHNYLFMRIPLLNPNPFLKRLAPKLGFLFTPQFLALVFLLASLDIYLLSQQWSGFSHAFMYVLTPEGLLTTGLMLSLSKVVHELGHALAASHFGCKVPAMGVALLMGMPVLWTDVSDAWRLPNRSQRLVIDAAGMLAELSLAALATLLWTLLPDGGLRSGFYVLASSAWLVTLGINLNPFMRFDGYYLLSDSLDIANLQDRAFALARWHLRTGLLNFDLPPPEQWPTQRRRLLIAYAYGVWLYRLVLFAGIAWAVYHFFFKALGLGLFGVEIGWFILRPIAKEISAWRQLASARAMPLRPRWPWLLVALVLALLVIPWQSHLLVPGLLRAEAETVLYSPQPAQIKQVWVTEGASVKAGQILMELTAPDLDFKINAARRRQAEIHELVASQSLDVALVRHNPMDLEALQSTLAELAGLEAERQKLTLRAPFTGLVRDLPEALSVAGWLAKNEVVGVVISPTPMVVAYAEEADLGRLERGATGQFYPDGGDLAAFPVRISRIDRIGSRQLALTELASTYGGGIAVREDAEHRLIPEQGVYRLTLSIENSPTALPIMVRGRLALSTRPESLVGRLLRSAAAVLVRESSW